MINLNKIVAGVFCIIHINVYADSFTNSIGMSFERIPAGSFVMGSCVKHKLCDTGLNMDIDAQIDETPGHKVTISKDFFIGTYEVTIDEYMKFIVDSDIFSIQSFNFLLNNLHDSKSAVSFVSWYDANNFIKWLNNKESCNCYRLPTEAEWEYVAKNGATDFYYSNKKYVGKRAWYDIVSKNIGNNRSHVVGMKLPNEFGVYDMQGNVWEWVQDWYGDKYYNNTSSNIDPLGPEIGKEKVDRGGAWNNVIELVRPANRSSTNPKKRLNYLGFRVVKEI